MSDNVNFTISISSEIFIDEKRCKSNVYPPNRKLEIKESLPGQSGLTKTQSSLFDKELFPVIQLFRKRK